LRLKRRIAARQGEAEMRRFGWVLALVATAAIAADKPTRFWNLTSGTVTGLRLSHAGSGAFGDPVNFGDEDGIDHDERAKLPELPAGKYDLELTFKDGRVCIVRHVDVVAGKVFSVEDKALTGCEKKK
jgi:hypothetical protein